MNKVIKPGLLGKIAFAEICSYYHMRNRNTVEQAPDAAAPDYLDWEMYPNPYEIPIMTSRGCVPDPPAACFCAGDDIVPDASRLDSIFDLTSHRWHD